MVPAYFSVRPEKQAFLRRFGKLSVAALFEIVIILFFRTETSHTFLLQLRPKLCSVLRSYIASFLHESDYRFRLLFRVASTNEVYNGRIEIMKLIAKCFFSRFRIGADGINRDFALSAFKLLG
jgi:hypothetical protein